MAGRYVGSDSGCTTPAFVNRGYVGMSEFQVALLTRLDYLISLVEVELLPRLDYLIALVAFLPIALLLVKAIIRIFWGRL